jgi:predicted RNase H-like HicB family nuclease/acyl carrier protein
MAKILFGIVCAVVFAIYAYMSLKITGRRYRAALLRVKERAPWPDDDFVRELALVPGTKEARIAVGIRQAFADWLHIPAGALRAENSLGRDSDMRALGDSLDFVELELLFEERADIAIPLALLSAIPSPYYKKTFGETVQAVLTLLVYPSPAPTLTIRIKQRENDHWLARVPELYGVVVHARTKEEAVSRAKRAAMHKIANRLERIVPKTAATFTVEVDETHEVEELLRVISSLG